MKTGTTIDSLRPGQGGVVTAIGSEGALRRRLIDMGLTPGARVVMKKTAPFGDPIEITVRGYQLSLRRSEARQITIEPDRRNVGKGAGAR